MSSVIQSSQSEIARRSIGVPSPLPGQGAGAGNAKIAGRPSAMPHSSIPPSGSEGLRAMAEEAEEDDEFSEDDFDDDFDDDFEEDLDDDLKEFEETIENAPDDDDDDDAEVGEPFEEEDDF
ncbi:MAG TPA: hypothetical protein VIK18_10890 [Pirellulales bacterium]